MGSRGGSSKPTRWMAVRIGSRTSPEKCLSFQYSHSLLKARSGATFTASPPALKVMLLPTVKPCFYCPFLACRMCKWQGGGRVKEPGESSIVEKNRPAPKVGAGRSITRKDTKQ